MNNVCKKVKNELIKKNRGGKEVLVEVLLIVIALSMVMLFKTQIIGMATDVFDYCEEFVSSNFSSATEIPEPTNGAQ